MAAFTYTKSKFYLDLIEEKSLVDPDFSVIDRVPANVCWHCGKSSVSVEPCLIVSSSEKSIDVPSFNFCRVCLKKMPSIFSSKFDVLKDSEMKNVLFLVCLKFLSSTPSCRKDCLFEDEKQKSNYWSKLRAVRAKFMLIMLFTWDDYDSLEGFRKLRYFCGYAGNSLESLAKMKKLELTAEEQGLLCVYCQKPLSFYFRDVTVEHLVPVSVHEISRGDNLCVSCDSCNVSRGNKSLSEWLFLDEKCSDPMVGFVYEKLLSLYENQKDFFKPLNYKAVDYIKEELNKMHDHLLETL